MGVGQPLDHGLARHGEKYHFPRVDIEHVLGNDGNSLRLQVIHHEGGVPLSHVHGGEIVHDLPAAEDLGLHGFPARAQLQHLVDEQFHGIGPIAAGHVVGVAVGQHEMVHPADAAAAVPEAGGDAGPEHRHDHEVFVRHEILPGQHLDGVVLEVVVEEEEGCLAWTAGAGLQFLQRRLLGGRSRGRIDIGAQGRDAGSPAAVSPVE